MSTQYRVKIRLQITQTDPTDDVDVFTDALLDHLLELNDEADLGGSVTDGTFDVWVTVDADSNFDALQRGCILVKAAAHAAGGHTGALELPQSWPEWVHEVGLAAELVDA